MTVKLKKCAKAKELARHVPFPDKDANKYSRGKAVVVGGAAAYPGAACLSSLAALRMGAGYVEVVCAPESLQVVRANPNVVARSWDGWTPAASRLDDADPARPAACLVGPGLEGVPDEAPMVLDVLRLCANPVVVDGGAVAALASEAGRTIASLRAEAGLATVVTPHLGEARRLGDPFRMRPPKEDLQRKDGARFAQQLADAYGATVLLKGPVTFIARSKMPHDGADDVVRAMRKGTPALAKAGTGDVLAGMVVALLAQGLAPGKAAELAAVLHARAGSIAAAALGEVSVCASDVAEAIPAAIAHIC